MSRMQMFHGYFKESTIEIDHLKEDTDEFIHFESIMGRYFVKVDNVVYEIWSSDVDIDEYGFCAVLPKSVERQLFLYWYNGGGEIHEVAASAIKRYLENEK